MSVAGKRKNIMGIIGPILIGLLIGAIVFWLVKYLMDLLEIPPPLNKFVLAIIILIIIIWVVERSGLF